MSLLVMGVRLGYACTVSVIEFRFPVVGLPLGVFPIGGYVCGFSIRETSV